MRAWFVICLLVTTSVTAAPTEENLLAAWEEAQRADPKVELLEATGEREYRFETTHFPYRGTLVLTEVVVDRMPGANSDAVGFVQVKLPDADDELFTDHAFAWSRWQRHNTLYWSEEDNRWLGWEEQQARWDEDAWQTTWWSAIDWIWIVFLAVLLLVVLLTSRKANRNVATSLAAQDEALAQQRKAMEMMERGIRVNEESNQLLREIRDLLKRDE